MYVHKNMVHLFRKLGKSKCIQLKLHSPSCWSSKTGNQFCNCRAIHFSDCTCVDQIQRISLGSGGSATWCYMGVGWCRYRGKSISNEKRYMTRKNESPNLNTWWFMVLTLIWSMYGRYIYPSCLPVFKWECFLLFLVSRRRLAKRFHLSFLPSLPCFPSFLPFWFFVSYTFRMISTASSGD